MKVFFTKITGSLYVLFLGISLSALATNAYGQAQWRNTYGGSLLDDAYAILQTSDGGYIVTGRAYSTDGDVTHNHGTFDVWVVKLDLDGNIVWQQTYGGSNDDEAYAIKQTTDGGYVLAGYSYSNDNDANGNHGLQDVWIIKLASDGSLSWQKEYGGSNADIAKSIQQTTDGGYIVAGYTYSADGDITNNHGNSEDVWVIKLASDGSMSWQQTYGGTNDDAAYDIENTADGGYIIACSTKSRDGDVSNYHVGIGADAWLLKIDNTGTIQWQKTFGGTNDDEANSVKQTPDGGYVFTGYTYSTDGDVAGTHGNQDLWVVSLMPGTNTIRWEKTYGGSDMDWGNDIETTTDGGFVIAGATQSNDGDINNYHLGTGADYWLVKLNLSGDIDWQNAMGGSDNDIATCVQQTSDGGYVFAGSTNSTDGEITTTNHGMSDFWVIKLASNVSVPKVGNHNAILVYPTATNGVVHMALPQGYEQAAVKIINELGQPIPFAQYGNDLNRTLAITQVPAGVYLLQVINKNTLNTYKISYHP